MQNFVNIGGRIFKICTEQKFSLKMEIEFSFDMSVNIPQTSWSFKLADRNGK